MERMERAGLRIEVALVPEERVGLVRRLASRPSQLLFRAVEVEARDLVFRCRRPVDLRVRVLEDRLVASLGQANDLDIVAAVGPPDPQLVLEDRTADVE